MCVYIIKVTIVMYMAGCCDKLFCGFVKLFLGENEVDLHIVSCLGISDNRKRIPYGELSGVDKQQICGCL